jgi:hypothetical protein
VRRNEEASDVGMEAPPDVADKPSSAPMDSMPLDPTPALTEPAPEPKPASQPNEPASGEPASSADADAWKERMRRARAAIDQRDFSNFEKEIELALSDAPSAQAKEQAKRLDQLGQLLKIYIDSIPESKKKAKGASSLKVGSAEVSIVESNQEKLIVRAGGKNQTYEWSKLPFGIAVALSDLSLSPTEPIDLAARAVYFSLDPFYRKEAASNQLIAKKVDEWFEKSAGKGQVRADLRQALTDSYE